jgi:hypothetical protein
MILQLHEILYKERQQRDPRNPELEQERKTLEQECLADLYNHCNDFLPSTRVAPPGTDESRLHRWDGR